MAGRKSTPTKKSPGRPAGKVQTAAKIEAVAKPALPAEPAATAVKVPQAVRVPAPALPPASEPRVTISALAASARIVARDTTNTIQTGAKTMNETIQKTQEATQQAAQKATEQFRGAMTDANERGKVAMEKGARFVEEMADLTRGNLEAMVASQKTAAKYVETLSQGAADYGRRSFEEASSALKSFAEVKSPTDFFRLQSDYARSAFDQMVAESSRVTETVVKMAGDVAEPMTSRYSVAAERLKAVAA